MIPVRNRLFGTIMSFLTISMMLIAAGCATPRQLPKGAVGNIGRVNYSPSVIETEGKRHFWWCSSGVNPANHSQNTDAIFYQSVNLATLQREGPPVLVLAESPGAWDSAYTCNPKVIAGKFKNPLGDGQTYTYAMYYVGTALLSGTDNSIGVAFSNDGIHWGKYPTPVIQPTSPQGYGVGQPALYYDDQKSSVRIFYEDTYPTSHHLAAVSSDGVHFTVQGTLTANGLNPDNPEPGWGDIAYEPKKREWYAIFNRPGRPISSTGGILERGNYGVELYKIPEDSLLTAGSSWQHLATMDTNATGFEANFIAGFVRDAYGNLDLASHNNIRMYTSISYPPPKWEASPREAGESADIANWILFPMEWTTSTEATVPLHRYFNGTVHEVTTGWISPDSDFQLERILGHLYRSHVQGAVPLYSCKAQRTDYFVSFDGACEGHRILGTAGYAYPQPVSGLNLLALYRCSSARDHFVSKDPKCEGQKTDMLLAYVLP
jgi:hypothetical protein